MEEKQEETLMPLADFDPDDANTQRSLRILAEQATRAAGQVARQYFGKACGVRLKADRSEVSEADEAAQTAAIACIHAGRPADAFVAEEDLPPAADHPTPTNDVVCWVIDPIDGTRNFVRGIPLYTCSVAAMFGGMPLVGAIYDVERDLLYSASCVEGFFINAEPQPSRSERTARFVGLSPRPVVGIPSSPTGPAAALAHRWLDRFVCRNLGSTALHLALVASGELDGALADNSRLWDIAAGLVLVTVTGGRLTSPTGEPVLPLDVQGYDGQKIPVLAATSAVHDQLLSR